MVQQAKIDEVENIRKHIEERPYLIFTNYRGLSVADLTSLRRELYGLNARFVVSKNTLLRIALKDKAFDGEDGLLVGPTAVVYSSEFPAEVAKKLVDFAKKNEALDIKGGFIEGQQYKAEDIDTIAKMPSREELLTRLVVALDAPIQKLARSLNGIVAKLAYALKAIEDKKKETEGQQ